MEKISTFSKRLLLAMNIRSISQTKLSQLSNINKSLICDYLKDRYIAKQDKLEKLANALNVSPVWLMGYDCDIDGKEKDDSTPPSNKYIDDIISILNNQDNETLEKILSMINLMIK